MKGPTTTISSLRSVRSLRGALKIALCLVFSACSLVFSKPVFKSSEIEGKGSEIMFCDLDGDHLKDILLIDEPNLVMFFQNASNHYIAT